MKNLILSLLTLCLLPLSLSSQGLTYHPVTPCRALDTRDALQSPGLQAGRPRSLPLATAPETCGLPSDLTGVVAYSINITIIPKGSKVGFLVAWATGTPLPLISLINSPNGEIIANHAIVQALASQSRAISFQATDDCDLVVDVDGYFN